MDKRDYLYDKVVHGVWGVLLSSLWERSVKRREQIIFKFILKWGVDKTYFLNS